MYVIPKLQWQERNTEHVTMVESKNTFIEYSIKYIDCYWYCFYGNGRHKVFKTLPDAKQWVEDTHYPAQVEKFLDKL